MQTLDFSEADRRAVGVRAGELLKAAKDNIHERTDRRFAKLMVFQWVAGIGAALWVSPRTWMGADSAIHWHVWMAVFLGGLITGFPAWLGWRHPGLVLTRHTIAIGQMLYSGLLIHLTGGRLETHFHIFGSLAFLAFYRDWRVLISATVVTTLDHFFRGIYWPQSIFGALTVSHWRWLEHSGWVLFADTFLIISIRQSMQEMMGIAERQASLQVLNINIEQKVVERTAELKSEIVERKKAEAALSEAARQAALMEVQLRQSQKMEAVGQLAAGIAHEINTPMQYIGDNIRMLKDGFEGLMPVLVNHVELVELAKKNPLSPEAIANAAAVLEGSDHKYLCEQIPPSFEQALEGVDRVTKIVRAMKEFSHPGHTGKTSADLNRCIESTVTVAATEWKYVAQLKLELATDLPRVPCFVGELNQCILNLLVNAAHAIGDVVKTSPGAKGLITVQTRRDGEYAEIRVQDTGTGIPEAARPRIFEPFFTTKEVGKGTGQGLSIVYASVVKQHGGTVTFETETGRGTTFIIRLPIKPDSVREASPRRLMETHVG